MQVRGISLELEGFTLVGQAYVPERCPAPALCLCHGIPRGIPEPGDRGYAILAERFCHAGFLTLIFNFRGTGGSGGNFDILGWTRDLGCILEHLAGMGEVQDHYISVMGFSAGAAVSVCVASQDPRVSCLITCACPSRFHFAADSSHGDSIVQHFRQSGIIRDHDFPPSLEHWLNGFNQVSPIERIAMISPRPLLIVHGSQDETVDPQDAWTLYDKAHQPKEIHIVRDAGHRLRLSDEAMSIALEWLTTHVRRH